MPKFYVYELLDRGVPFYVGKGQGDRIDQHEKHARQGRDSRLCRHIREMQADDRSVEKKKLFFTDNEAEAFQVEKEYVSKIGLDKLDNVLPGGGAICPDAIRQAINKKISVSNMGRPATMKGKPSPTRGKKASAETLLKLSAAHKGAHGTMNGRHHTEEARRKMSESQKGKKKPGRILTLEHKQKIAEAGRGRKHSEETRRKIGEANRNRSTEVRRKLSEAMMGNKYFLGRHHSDETKLKMSESMKGKKHTRKKADK
jgi:hypothetical protein